MAKGDIVKMSDFYEDRDYKYDDDSGNRRRRKRLDRARRMEDDAWGAAYYQDSFDGDAADVEDWAAGMEVEEGRRYARQNTREYYDDPLDDFESDRTNDGVRSPRSSRSGRIDPQDIGAESPAMRRADQLMRRYGRQGRMREIPTDQSEMPDDRIAATGDFVDDLFNFRFDRINLTGTIPTAIFVLIAILVIMALACVAAAWITATEVREALDLNSFLWWI